MKNFMGADSSSVMLRVVSRDTRAGRGELVEFVLGFVRVGRRSAEQLAHFVDLATKTSDSVGDLRQFATGASRELPQLFQLGLQLSLGHERSLS